jgi:hypothetical protein
MVRNTLDSLVQLLKSQKRGVRLGIAWVLARFAIGGLCPAFVHYTTVYPTAGVVGAKVIKAGVHDSLIWMLKSRNTDMRQESLWVLSKLVNAKYGRFLTAIYRAAANSS